mmetsp:Transcript_10908/g.30907  ORF Transcript_10908/g.30907 Transcript_10908/m.30907 type:complete len:222 (+) Transcript_10908:145-810(+)
MTIDIRARIARNSLKNFSAFSYAPFFLFSASSRTKSNESSMPRNVAVISFLTTFSSRRSVIFSSVFSSLTSSNASHGACPFPPSPLFKTYSFFSFSNLSLSSAAILKYGILSVSLISKSHFLVYSSLILGQLGQILVNLSTSFMPARFSSMKWTYALKFLLGFSLFTKATAAAVGSSFISFSYLFLSSHSILKYGILSVSLISKSHLLEASSLMSGQIFLI